MTPMRVRTGWRHSPSLGTPSAKVSAPSATGSHKCLMNRDTYALMEDRRIRKVIRRNAAAQPVSPFRCSLELLFGFALEVADEPL